MAGYFRINRIRLEFKDFLHRQELLFHVVLIESDWNLKYPQKRMTRIQNSRINRIRLEFKAGSAGNSSDSSCSINRIRLEFKVASTFGLVRFCEGINRIRLEFKAVSLSNNEKNRPY